ncbi:DUF4142 domain-containing protein [Nocardia sp. N2S4-5]|uniref:DUF4142 domain-containing protein n=1 Tax=Nocardia sp. N2S4-5 TaxID=3351565 RepID=UPI0037CFCC2A
MPTLRRALIAGVSVLAAGFGAAGAAHAEAALAQPDRDFLIAAHQSHLTEIAAGGRATAMSSCPAVRQLAPALVADHMRLDQMVTATAARNGVALPALPNSAQTQSLADTAPRTGRDFDIAWLRMQEQGHLAALQNGQQELAAGGAPDVRGVAEQATPLVEEHLTEVRAALAKC